MGDEDVRRVRRAVVVDPRLEAVDLERPWLVSVSGWVARGVRVVEGAERVAVDPDVDGLPVRAPRLDAQVEVATRGVRDDLRPLDAYAAHPRPVLDVVVQHLDPQGSQRVDS